MSKETNARTNAIERTIADMVKRHGPGSLMRLGDRKVQNVEVVPTGSTVLDDLLGVGGYPRGRVVEIYGPEASGKTTLTLHAIAEVQRMGGTAAFVDAEHALDVQYAKNLGVDTEQLLVAQPDSGEQALEITEALVRSGALDLVVIDSVAALVPRAEIEGEMGDHHLGLQARLMSQALRKITAITSKTGTLVMFINQLRQKIGVTFGSNETTTGGNALKFYSSIRIDIRRGAPVRHGDETIGNRAKIKVVKNKVAPPFRRAEVEIIYGRGICRAGQLMDAAEAKGLLSKSGSWISLGETRIGNGREKCREALYTDAALFETISSALTSTPAVAK